MKENEEKEALPVFEKEEATESKDPLALLRRIKGLDVDSAIDAMSGLPELYIDTVQLTVNLLPERIEKMDRFLDSDLKSFTIEVHGMKSALKNIGSGGLGNSASKLERAALDGDEGYCKENYPAFKTGLIALEKELSAALPEDTTVKETSDISSLLPAIAEAKTAAESFDRDGALEIISPHAGFSYGEKADGLLKQIISALEAFDCENALNKMNELEEN
jgi:HPt (histidine-containing phosphotransfer) domain-containing protein